MSMLHVFGFGLKVGQSLWMRCCWVASVVSMNWLIHGGIEDTKTGFLGDGRKMWVECWDRILGKSWKIHNLYYQSIGSKKVRIIWWRRVLVAWFVFWALASMWVFWYLNGQTTERRKEALASMCDERARMLQDQFNVSMNHVQAMSILISTFHHGKNPSAIDQRTFARYTERTAFERPLTSGVAYAVRVLHSEREQFEKQQGWTIKRMDTLEHNPVHKDDYNPEASEPSPIQEEYAPVIFAQDTISHVVSLDMLSGTEDRENVLRARASGKGVLTAPFRLIKSNRLGVILTFAVYKRDLPSNATPDDRIEATDGYLGGVFDIESLVEKLLQQLASKQTILVNVHDTTNPSHPISMYGSNVSNDELEHVSSLNFGDPYRKHEMRCRFKHKAPWPWLAITTSVAIIVIASLVGQIFYATVSRIVKVEEDYKEIMELNKKAQAADVAKSQFLATVSHEIRTPMNGVLGMLDMLMDTELDGTQQDYVRTAQGSGRTLISLINEVLDQAKVESGKLELEEVSFDLRAILDDVLSLFSGKSQEKGVELELAVYISDRVPKILVGDPVRFRQIISNLMGNSIKFTKAGHIFITVHLVEEMMEPIEVETVSSSKNTLSGRPVADRRRSWEGFRAFNQDGSTCSFKSFSSDLVNLIVSVEDTGEGIPLESQTRIFTPFMQVDPSISRLHGGTGIGLSISKYLVSRMNGEIGFVSVPEIGSTFTFTAVLGSTTSNSNEQQSQPMNGQSNSVSSELKGMTALLVDHRPTRAKVSRYHIQRIGIHVEVVSDLNEGITCIGNGNMVVNMVLVEQEVWERDASTSTLFTSNLRKFDHGAPKLFLLAKHTSSLRMNTTICGVYTPTVITKPLRASKVAADLQRALGIGNKGNPIPSLYLRNLLAGRKILIVDDNRVNLRVAAGALKKYGADVECAECGIKATNMLKPPHPFHACFMDIQMPGMDGFQATRIIREEEQRYNNSIHHDDDVSNWHVPILAMTADVIQATHDECIKCGMDGYVSKPFEAEQLYREVSRVVPFL